MAILATIAILGITVFLLLPKKGHLRIEAKDEGGAAVDRAEIFVDGQKVCDATPCIMRNISPGVRTIKVVIADGRMSEAIQEDVRPGEESSITIPVARAAAARPMSSREKPTPAASPMPAESQAQSASVERPSPAAPSSPVTAQSTSLLPATSKPTSTSAPASSASASAESGMLNINSIPVAKIVLDGRALGNTPRLGVVVSAGSHTIQFIHAQLGKRSVTVTVKAGETKTASTKFE
jgi:hypothetical protein